MRSEILRDTGALLRVVRRVFDARVPPRRDVANHGLPSELGRPPLAIVRVGIAGAVLVVVLVASVGDANRGIAGSVGPSGVAV